MRELILILLVTPILALAQIKEVNFPGLTKDTPLQSLKKQTETYKHYRPDR